MRKLLSLFFIGMFLLTGTALAAEKSKNIHPLYQPAGNSIAGNPKGDITVVEFFDYNCGYCRMMYPSLLKMVGQDNSLRVIFREYPVLSPRSELPARAALAAQKQGKYEALHNAMMEAKMPLDQSEIVKLAKQEGIDTDKLIKDMQSDEVSNQIEANLAMGQSMNIQGVPTFVVIKTEQLTKAQPEIMVGPSASQLQDMIDKAKNA